MQSGSVSGQAGQSVAILGDVFWINNFHLYADGRSGVDLAGPGAVSQTFFNHFRALFDSGGFSRYFGFFLDKPVYLTLRTKKGFGFFY